MNSESAAPGPSEPTEPAALPPAGWYPDPQHAYGQRWWNGTTWTENQQATQPYGMANVGPKPSNPLALVGFILGLAGLLLALWGLIPAAALILSLLGLNRSQRIIGPGGKRVGRVFAIWGIVLGAVGLAYVLIVFAIGI
jgi:Protein of unknown function (DUF2510)